MNRLSRQLAASSRIIRCSNGPIARIPSSSFIRSRNYAKKPDHRERQPTTSSVKTQTKAPSSTEGNSISINNVDDLIQLLESSVGQEALRRMPGHASRELGSLMSNVVQEDGEDDVRVMHDVAQHLSMFGLAVEVTRPLPAEELDRIEDEVVHPERDAKNADESTEDETPILRPYPNLMSADPLMDSREVLDLGPTPTNPFHNRVIVRNHRSIFHESMALDGFDFNDPKWRPTKSDLAEEEMDLNESAGLEQHYPVDQLMKFELITRNTTQQTGKGKINHFQAFTIVGDGDGMVGLGMGTDTEPATALNKAHVAALKNMDYVDRFENRTIWTEMSGKFRSTQIKMRPRPMGFGLRCQPILHQVLKAAGIKDVSAKVWGSRNPIMIMQGALRMLQGGHNPLGFGNGIGGKGKTLTKGIGMRSKLHLERERGRRLFDFRK